MYPRNDDVIYIVRISENKEAKKDYNIFKEQHINNQNAFWDKDSKNRMKKGDWLGFIVGPKNNEMVELYLIENELSKEYRPNHWQKNTKYTNQNTLTLPKTREVIILSNQSKIEMLWREWKNKVNYKVAYMPRGTTKSRNPFI